MRQSAALAAASLRRPLSLLAAIAGHLRRHRRGRILARLGRDQLHDAGTAWELAGYGRGADVSMLAKTNLEAQR